MCCLTCLHIYHSFYLQVFDSFVIIASFIVDMIFVKGLTMYTIHEFVYILAFMLPWRVIRVTNSKYLSNLLKLKDGNWSMQGL